MELSELQRDLLTEAFNLGVGKAAASLSELAGGEEILLSVPEIQIESVSGLEREIRSQAGDEVCGVSEHFRGPFSGRAMMLYSQAESLELVKIMLGHAIPVEELSDMEGEALCEVGNIVLNACISTLADLLETEIETDVPGLQVGDTGDVINSAFGASSDQNILYLRMQFSLANHKLTGHIGFFLDVDTTEALATQLEYYFQKMLSA